MNPFKRNAGKGNEKLVFRALMKESCRRHKLNTYSAKLTHRTVTLFYGLFQNLNA